MKRFVLSIFMVLCQTGAAMAFGACDQPGYLAQFAISNDPEPCEEIATHDIVTAGGVTKLRLIRLSRTPHGDDSRWTDNTRILAERLGPEIDAVGARLPEEITLLLTDATRQMYGLDLHAVVQSLITYDTGVRECAVPFYKLGRDVAVEEFVMDAAHEVFHCAQRVTWPDAYRTEGFWWMEGSAEYFGHLVMQESRLRDAWFAEFDRRSATEDLTAMKYENVVFFMFIAQEGGPAGVGDFLGAMRAGPQIPVLQEIMSTDDWARFVEAHIDGVIERPGGDQLPPATHFTSERSISRRDVIEIANEPFVATRHRLTFEAEKIHELGVEVRSGAPLTAMRLDDATSVWDPPPPTVSACDENQVYVLYSVDVDQSASSTLTVETDDDDTGGRCCLVGEWKPTADALLGFADFGMEVGAGPIAAQGGNMQCGYMEGDWTVWFRDNGEGLVTFNDTTNECQVTHSGQRMAVTSSRNGTTAFKWTIKGPGAGTLTYTSHDVFWNMVMKLGPIAQDISNPDAGPSVDSHGFAFSCEGNDLVLQGLYGLSHKEVQHVRVVEPE